MDYKIVEASNLPAGEKIYLKKDFLGWRVVEPWKDPETGKINWFNFIFGGKRGIVFMIVISLIAGLAYIGITELVSNYQMIANNPCNFCEDCFQQTRNVIDAMNLTKIKF